MFIQQKKEAIGQKGGRGANPLGHSLPHLVPALPECITEGETMEELELNLKDAIQGWLEVANDNHTLENNAQILEVAL